MYQNEKYVNIYLNINIILIHAYTLTEYYNVKNVLFMLNNKFIKNFIHNTIHDSHKVNI